MSIWKPSLKESIILGSYLDKIILDPQTLELVWIREETSNKRHLPKRRDRNFFQKDLTNKQEKNQQFYKENEQPSKEVNKLKKGVNDEKCQFCLSNGEEFYQHRLKDDLGRILCPNLSTYKCKICGATGEVAHTWKYCPQNPITKGFPIGFPPGLPAKDFSK